jgi:hypothetical protein
VETKLRCKEAIYTLVVAFGYSAAIAFLARKWLDAFGYSSRMSVLANGNTSIPAEVYMLYSSTSDEEDAS